MEGGGESGGPRKERYTGEPLFFFRKTISARQNISSAFWFYMFAGEKLKCIVLQGADIFKN